MLFNGKHYIFINESLTDLDLIKTIFHELAHHFLHRKEMFQGAMLQHHYEDIEPYSTVHAQRELEADCFAFILIWTFLCPFGLKGVQR